MESVYFALLAAATILLVTKLDCGCDANVVSE
jgi:hypothetical protein